MRRYHALARIVQPGPDRGMCAALFLLAVLLKQSVICDCFVSFGKVNFDGVAGGS